MSVNDLLRNLPSVETVLADRSVSRRINDFSRKGITRLVREALSSKRRSILSAETVEAESGADLLKSVVEKVAEELKSYDSAGYRRVLNAVGVIIHTNLGRALFSEVVMEEVDKAGSAYVDLEIDLETLNRTKREARAARIISLLTGAEDAHIVNNNAAAVLLAVETLAGKGAVAVSRGELVEIGGSFRLPEILDKAAGRVIEVGTTNRTHTKDYIRAVEEGATLLLKVHRSNFRVSGYTKEVPLAELARLGRKHKVPVMYDQGGGLLFRSGLKEKNEEEAIDEIMPAGVDIITFSADKLLGGPQGGVVIGSSDLIKRMRENHLSRALRVDKLTLAGLQKVLSLYWNGEIERIRVLKAASAKYEEIRSRAAKFAESLKDELRGKAVVSMIDGESAIGGGTFPNNPLRTRLIKITLPGVSPESLSGTLRRMDPAVLVRIKGDSVLIDLRTIPGEEEELLLESLLAGLGNILRGSD